LTRKCSFTDSLNTFITSRDSEERSIAGVNKVAVMDEIPTKVALLADLTTRKLQQNYSIINWFGGLVDLLNYGNKSLSLHLAGRLPLVSSKFIDLESKYQGGRLHNQTRG